MTNKKIEERINKLEKSVDELGESINRMNIVYSFIIFLLVLWLCII